MITIAVSIPKGGTGKTTSVSGIASCLHAAGKRVLLIDLDGQQNLSFLEGVDVVNLEKHLFDVFTGRLKTADAVIALEDGKDILVGGPRMFSAGMEFFRREKNERMLKDALKGIRRNYDYAVIDTSPSLGWATINALTAADSLIIPMLIDSLSIQGFAQFYEFIRNVKNLYNHKLEITGILINKYDDGRSIVTQALEPQIKQLAELAGTRVFNTRIHMNKPLQTAQAQQDSNAYQRRGFKAAIDYQSLTQELLQIYEGGQ